ncbi:MAG: zinc ribbon domain-containing protein [Prevotella sp.]|nr:zinc ribbon domain-containing protein [Prevotella sp.]
MKCFKCNAEIPDGSKFCMECGAKQEVLQKCPSCGTEGLPLEAKFCPNCGKELKQEPTVKQPVTPADVRDLFFPIQGITLGKTTKADAIRLRKVVDVNFDGDYAFQAKCEEICDGYMSQSGPKFVLKDKSYVANYMSFMSPKHDYPEEWTERLGLTPDSTRSEWTAFFRKNGFSVEETHHDSGFLRNTDIVDATSKDGRLHFNLLFLSSTNKLGQLTADYQ